MADVPEEQQGPGPKVPSWAVKKVGTNSQVPTWAVRKDPEVQATELPNQVTAPSDALAITKGPVRKLPLTVEEASKPITFDDIMQKATHANELPAIYDEEPKSVKPVEDTFAGVPSSGAELEKIGEATQSKGTALIGKTAKAFESTTGFDPIRLSKEALDVGRLMVMKPVDFVASLFSSPAKAMYLGLKEFSTQAALPGDINEKAKQLFGDMTPDEAEEARRTFLAFLGGSILGGVAGELAEGVGAAKGLTGLPKTIVKGQAQAAGFGIGQALVQEPTAEDKLHKALAYAIIGAPLALGMDALLFGKGIDAKLSVDDIHNLRTLRHEVDGTTISSPTLGDNLEVKQELHDQVAIGDLSGVQQQIKETSIPQVSKQVSKQIDNLASERLDIVGAIIKNLAEDPNSNQIKFLHGVDNPFAVAKKLTNLIGEDKAFYSFFKRDDGKFDIAIGTGKSGFFDASKRIQFQKEGYFAGQNVSVDGKDFIYDGRKDENNAWVRQPGDSRRNSVEIDRLRKAPWAQEINVRKFNIDEMRDVIKDDGVFNNLKEAYNKIYPENGHIEKTDLENMAASNGFHINNTSGMYILRDRETYRFIQSFRNEEAARKFIDASGQKVSPELLKKPDIPVSYHGSKVGVNELQKGIKLDGDGVRKSDAGDLGLGFYTHSDKEFADNYAGEKGTTVAISNQPKNPLILDFDASRAKGSNLNKPLPGTAHEQFINLQKELGNTTSMSLKREQKVQAAKNWRDGLMAKGYDGVIAKGYEGGGTTTTVFFKPEDVKFSEAGPPDGINNIVPPISSGPPPGLNEPFELPRNKGKIENWLAALNNWWTEKRYIVSTGKHFERTEELHGVPVSTEGYHPTQKAKQLVLSQIAPWHDRVRKELQVGEDLSAGELEQVHNALKAKSPDELATQMNPKELDLAKSIAANGTDIIPILIYNERKNLALKTMADQMGVKPSELKLRDKRLAIKQLAQSLNLTDQDARVGKTLVAIAKSQPDNFSLFNVINYVKAVKEQAVSQDELFKTMPGKLIALTKKVENLRNDFLKTTNIPDISKVDQMASLIHDTREVDPTFMSRYKSNKDGWFSATQSYISDMLKTGQVNFYSKDPINSLVQLIDGYTSAQEFLPIWKQTMEHINTDISRRMQAGQLKPKEAAFIKQTFGSYMQGILGRSEMSTAHYDAAMQRLLTAWGFKDADKVSFRDDGINTFTAFYNGVAMGYRPSSAIRDFWSVTKVYSMLFGTERMRRAYQLARTADVETMRSQGLLTNYSFSPFSTPEEMYDSALGKSVMGMSGWIKKEAEQAMTASRIKNVYEFWQTGSYLEGRERALEQLNKLVDGKIDKNTAYKNMQLDRYSPVIAKKIDDLVTSGGQVTEAADFFGRVNMREVTPLYGLSNHPYGWSQNHARLFGQYGVFNTWYTPTLLKALSQGSQANVSRAWGILAASTLAEHSIGRVLGVNMRRFTSLPGLLYTGGPALDIMRSITDASFGTDVQSRLAKRHLWNMINPASSSFIAYPYVLKDWVHAAAAISQGNPVAGIASGALSVPIRDQTSGLLDF